MLLKNIITINFKVLVYVKAIDRHLKKFAKPKNIINDLISKKAIYRLKIINSKNKFKN